MAHSEISIAVIGGGIGGLATALSLLQAGFNVQVYEQAQQLREVGAGIQISPNASRVLHRLGLADKLATIGVQPSVFRQRRWNDGGTLFQMPLGETVKTAFGYPNYQFHRADLLNVLIGSFPADRLHLAHRLVDLVDHGDRVQARFENGKDVTVDALVGADGIHSAVRRVLFGSENPQFAGCVAYRGLVPADKLADLQLPVDFQVWIGPHKHFVHYFVQGRRLVNFAAVVEQDSWTRESWTDRGDVAQALAAFEGWNPQVRSILGAVEEIFVWGLFDRSPMKRWSNGRVTLLGDACHAMLPFIAQGAAQAIEDGATLAASLTKMAGQDIPGALRLYESLRIPRTSRIQSASSENKARLHMPDGPQQQQRDAQMLRGAADSPFRAFAWIFAHDATVADGAIGMSGA